MRVPKAYTKDCDRCGKRIEWDNTERKFYNVDNGEHHRCGGWKKSSSGGGGNQAAKFIVIDRQPLDEKSKLIVKKIVKEDKVTGFYMMRIDNDANEDDPGKGCFIPNTEAGIEAAVAILMRCKKAI